MRKMEYFVTETREACAFCRFLIFAATAAPNQYMYKYVHYIAQHEASTNICHIPTREENSTNRYASVREIIIVDYTYK